MGERLTCLHLLALEGLDSDDPLGMGQSPTGDSVAADRLQFSFLSDWP
jgi:hypothetical protein